MSYNYNRSEDELVREHLGLVRSIANKYSRKNKHPHIDFDDIYQAGCRGLLRALRKYDPTKKIRFSTWIYNPIHWEIINFVNRVKSTPPYSKMHDNIPAPNNDNAAVEELLETLDAQERHVIVSSLIYNVTDKQISEELNISKKKVSDIKNRAKDKIIEICIEAEEA